MIVEASSQSITAIAVNIASASTIDQSVHGKPARSLRDGHAKNATTRG